MMNNNPLFSWQDIAGIVPKLLENLPVTLGITLASLLLGLTIALLIVLLQFSRFSRSARRQMGIPTFCAARLWRC
jgi:L-cystine transport system permease protein